MGLIRAVMNTVFWKERQKRKPLGPRWPLLLFHVDTGGCGGCGMELQAMTCLPYDMQGAGFGFVNSPRSADVLLVTGALTRTIAPVLQAAWEAMPNPKGIISIGNCALDGGVFSENYAVMGGLERRVSVDLAITGCPPSPQEILNGLCSLLGSAAQGDKKETPSGG
ncbi:NADH-quinone oxidoreductase subunit B family protein [Acetobacter fabarum]|uniref:NADH-quinone oxidoreductase subunit B family protein n=1 Tax=Acetobacter fabarum TaxID=483199 RepID=UPI00209F37FA|nr:NADH-quinone oxidoreductase subunit B [Acetobacter fabarum]MCP1226979.1 NADH-quinone oxidoreductase subunit B [Acetobacter fabarum]MCP1232493.1 NADH-quinone oxidoreductase subunit B [Acetobacter fabarum]